MDDPNCLANDNHPARLDVDYAQAAVQSTQIDAQKRYSEKEIGTTPDSLICGLGQRPPSASVHDDAAAGCKLLHVIMKEKERKRKGRKEKTERKEYLTQLITQPRS